METVDTLNLKKLRIFFQKTVDGIIFIFWRRRGIFFVMKFHCVGCFGVYYEGGLVILIQILKILKFKFEINSIATP